METKYITIPFDLERAKRICSGEEQGKIVTRDGRSVRIICFDLKNEKMPIISAVTEDSGLESATQHGISGNLLFQGTHNRDLLLSVPEWTTFKDGDVYKTERGSVAIFNGNYKAIMNNTPYYVGLRECDGILIFQSNDFGFGIMSKCTLDVSEEDRQKLIDALKASDHPLAKKYLKRFFPNHSNPANTGKEYKLKPFDKVLCRDHETHKWIADIFSNMLDDGRYCCIGLNWRQCIPYNEQTKHLLGTTEDWEDNK